MPRRSRKPFNSGMDFTWRDQLQTPTSRGFMARLRRSSCGFDPAADGAEVAVVPPVLLVEGAELVELQLGHLLRPGPDDGFADLLGHVHEAGRLRLVEAEHLAE